MTGTDGAGQTIAHLLCEASDVFAGRGVGAPGLDARLLLAHVLKCDQACLIRRPGENVGHAARDEFRALVARRAAREPVSRILGWREFYGREFKLSPSVLDPRPDSETLIEAALSVLGDEAGRPWRICDLGTGSGALLVTLLAECPRAVGLGMDIDAAAVHVARDNARSFGVERRAQFCVADWAEPIDGCFDLVVANPPYIDRELIEGLAPEVRDHDPRRALDGGPGGLEGHRAAVAAAARLADPRGCWLAVEIGSEQAGPVSDLICEAGFSMSPPLAGVKYDLAGMERVVVAFRPSAQIGQK